MLQECNLTVGELPLRLQLVQLLNSMTHWKRFRIHVGVKLILFWLVAGGHTCPALAERHYLSNTNIAIQLLPPPSEPASLEQSADLAEVSLAHHDLVSNGVTFARSEKHVFIFTFTPAIGSFFQTNRFLKTEAFFQRVLKETDRVVDAGKDFWMRPRPYLVDTNLLDGELEKLSGSYPSGHSTRGTVFALLLSELFPDHRDAVLAKGREIGWHRVMLAKHYPTDIYAGRVLGRSIVQQMKANHAFRHDFNEVKAEIESWMQRNSRPQRSMARSGL
jgi:acid phosphatase (class A)